MDKPKIKRVDNGKTRAKRTQNLSASTTIQLRTASMAKLNL